MYIPNPTLYVTGTNEQSYKVHTMHCNRMMEMFDLAGLSLERIQRYAKRHGYDLVMVDSE